MANNSVFVTTVYLYIRNPVFHEVSYAALVSIMVLVPPTQIMHIGKTQPTLTKGLWFLYFFSFFTYGGAFALWNIENLNCEVFRGWRVDVGYPVRVVAELHSWWHLGTAIGSYASIQLNMYLRLLALGRTDIEMAWYGLPVLVMKSKNTKKRE
ncbi:hypothetical protein HDU76_005404 [Blyttiomyces sp. JEL0837]|nr:hypothetical protein HDU76_005404 [Blyttiomyces sp. JEL0837]